MKTYCVPQIAEFIYHYVLITIIYKDSSAVRAKVK